MIDEGKQTPIDLETARKVMEEKLRKFMSDAISGGNQGKVLNLRVPAGAGKSYATTKMISELMKPHEDGSDGICWFGSMHDQYNDFKEFREDKWVHLKGRNKDNCKYSQEVKALGNKRYNIITNFCRRKCGSYMAKCEYRTQLEKKGHRFLAHQMLFFYDGIDTPLVVFDELVPRVFIDEYLLDANEIIKHVRNEEGQLWMILLNLMTKKKELSGKALYTALDSALEAVVEGEDLKSKIERLEVNSDEDIDIDNISDMPIYRIGEKIKDIMLSELACIETDKFNPRIIVNPKDGDSTEISIEIRDRKDPPEWLKDKPIVLLGAKGAPEVFQKVLGRDESDFENYTPLIHIPDKVEIIKESTDLYAKKVLKYPNVRKDIADEIKKHMESDLKTFLIARKEYEQSFSKHLNITPTEYSEGKVVDGYQSSGHYWGVRGLNEWKDYEQAIIIGAPIPNVDGVIRQAQAVYWDEIPLNTKMYHTLADVYDFKDERIGWYMRSLREDELYQAIYRIRPLELNGRAKIKIIVATSLPLEEIDALVTHKFTIVSRDELLKKIKYNHVLEAARVLIEQGSFYLNELADEAHHGFTGVGLNINSKYVYKHRNRIAEDLNLIIEKDKQNNNALRFMKK